MSVSGPGDSEDEDGALQPDVIDALISMDPYLSDFREGNIVGRDGQPMTEVEHVRILDATPGDLEAARAYLDLKREADLARYDAIDRLADLTSGYGDDTTSLRGKLPLMPPGERAEAEQILARVQPRPAAQLLTEDQRRAEYTRLLTVGAQVEEYLKADHYLIHDGKLVTDERTGQPVNDQHAKLHAIDILLRIHDSTDRLLGLTGTAPEITVTAEEAAAKLHALEEQAIPPIPGLSPDGG